MELAHYLSTILKVRVRKFRVLLGHFIKIIILLRIRAVLCRLTLNQSPEISRITWRLYIKIHILLRIRALHCHLTLCQSAELARITWLLYKKNSYTPMNTRITWPPYFK